MSDNPFDKFPPLAEVEEGAWELNFAVTPGAPAEARKDLLKRLTWFFIAAGAMFLLLTLRLIYIQVIQGQTYRLIAQGNSIRTSEVPAPRGLILDRWGSPIVGNKAGFSLEIIPAYLPAHEEERKEVLESVRLITGLKAGEEEIQKKRPTLEPIVLAQDIPYEQALVWEIKLTGLSGVSLVKRPFREYRDLPGIAHLAGFVGKISPEELTSARLKGDEYYRIASLIGKSGLEYAYEKELRGIDGKTQLEVDAQGKKIRQLASLPASPGNTLQLFLEPKIQRTLSTSLESAVKKAGSRAGAAVAVDPKTGGILGMTSFPTYRPDTFSGSGNDEEVNKLLSDPRHPLVNRVVAGLYPPGSTIKPLWAAAALQEATITPKTIVSSVGGFYIGQFAFKDWKEGGHGPTDVKKAIAESVNTFFYAVAGGHSAVPGLGVERLKRYAHLFGIGDKTGIDLPSENKGFFPDPEWKQRTRGERWFIGNTYQLGIGQGDVLVTPIEILMAMTSLVNGGELLQPRLVQQVIDPSGQVVKDYGKKVTRQNFINRDYLQTVKEAMRMTVKEGSARQLNNLPVEAGGKTGTAQYAANKKTHAWFFGFAPWQDPEIALIVLIEGGGEGTTVAAPVAAEVLRDYFSR